MENKNWNFLKEFHMEEQNSMGVTKFTRSTCRTGETNILSVRNVGDGNLESVIQIDLKTIKSYISKKGEIRYRSTLTGFAVPKEFVEKFVKAMTTEWKKKK
jgi:5-methylthioribose kinase